MPVALSGSPSQVEWAQRIRVLVNADFDRVARVLTRVALKQSGRRRADIALILAILEDKRAAVMSRTEAGYFIHDWQEISDQVRKMIAQDPRYQAITKASLMEAKEMNIRPLYDRIVVKRSEEKETSRNGIIIPDSAREKPQEGEVIAVGHGKRLDNGSLVALDVKAGDRILFGKYSGSETKLDGTEYIIIREDDVLGILSGAEKTAAA